MFDPELQGQLTLWILITGVLFVMGAFGFALRLFPGGIKNHGRLVRGRWGYRLGFAYMLLNGMMLVLLLIVQFAPQHPFSVWLANEVMTIGTESVDRSQIILIVWVVGVAAVHLLSLFVPDNAARGRTD